MISSVTILRLTVLKIQSLMLLTTLTVTLLTLLAQKFFDLIFQAEVAKRHATS